MKNNLLKNTLCLKKKGSRIEGQDSWPRETEERGCGVEEDGGKELWGRGKEGAGLGAWSDQGLQAVAGGEKGAWRSLTKGLPCMDVDDEPGNLVSTQDLVIHCTTENRGVRAGAAAVPGGPLLLSLITWSIPAAPCSPGL